MRRIKYIFPFLFLAIFMIAPVSAVNGAYFDIYFDWPMGAMLEEELVLGQGIYIMQNFRNRNENYDDRQHAGIDLSLDAGAVETAGAVVYAAANGTVVCIDTETWGSDGDVVAIEHTLSFHDTVYSVYGHLDDIFVELDETVQRGQPIGTLLDQADNSHLHYEIREFLNWPDRGCAAPGYKPLDNKTLEEYGWLDPVEFYADNRRPFPRSLVVNERMSNLVLDDMGRREIAVFSEPIPDKSHRIAVLPGGARITALDFETIEASDGRTHGWYEVKYDGVNSGYILGIWDDWWDGDIRVGEPLGLWQPPLRRPLIEYRFDSDDIHWDYVWNWGWMSFLLMGKMEGVTWLDIGDNWVTGSDDYALKLDGYSGHVNVLNSSRLQFQDGLKVEAMINRTTNENEDAIASKWFYGEDQWLLTIYPEGKGMLIFTVRLKDGDYATVDHMIPDLLYRNTWIHVAASYSSRDGLALYWDKELVAQKTAAELEAEGYSLEDRQIFESSMPVHIGDANNEWSRFQGLIDDIKIWQMRDGGLPFYWFRRPNIFR